MAPPGRRKASLRILIAIFTFLILSTTASAASAVLGIDVGTEYLKAAVAKPGSPIEIVLTKDSKRKEAATIAFKPSKGQANDPEAFPERLYGGDAVALSARYPSDVYPNLKSLLGLPRDGQLVHEYELRYPGLVLEAVSRTESKSQTGSVGLRSENFSQKKETFMVEELLAMELKNIKANAEAAVVKGSLVTDAVLTYPAFYTAEEKRAIELAAELAGLHVLAMISDGLAVGLNYATNRVFDSVSDGAKPEYHLVYDMGAGSTTATVLKFQGRTVKGYGKRNQTIQEVQVVGTGFDRTLGGDSLNDIIVNDMIDKLLKDPKVSKLGLKSEQIRTHGKTMARLWKDAERLRHVVSANSASSATFEGLYSEDINFKYSLKRDYFEELASGHFARVDIPLTQALDSAGVTLMELDSIILHGGAVRTPFVQKRLEATVGGSGKIKTNVNADEAAVMGAAFKAATISPSYRVKDIRAIDVSGTIINLKWTADGKERQQKLFNPLSQIGPEKQVPIKILEDVKFGFEQDNGAENLKILEVQATNLTKSANELKEKYGCAASNISTTFTMRLSPLNGLPEITLGSVSCEADSSKEGGVFDNVKGLFGFGSKKTDDQQVMDDDKIDDNSSTTLTPLPVSDPTSSDTTISSASSTDSSQESSSTSTASKAGKISKATPSTITIPLALQTTTFGLNTPPSSLPQIRQRLSQFDSSDRNAALRSEALNTLEAFTYRAREYLEDSSFIAVSSDKARKELQKQISATSEWLYGEGVEARLQDFKDKLKSLKGLVEPALKRKTEGNQRSQAVKAVQEGLEGVNGMIEMVKGSVVKAAQEASLSASSAASSIGESVTASASELDDLDEDPYSAKTGTRAEETEFEAAPFKAYEYTEDDLNTLMKSYNAAKSWLEEKLALQEKLGPYDDPAVLVADLESKAKDLQKVVSDAIMKSIKMQELPKKSKSAKKTKAKGKKTKSSSASSGSGTAESSSTTSSVSAQSSKDEL